MAAACCGPLRIRISALVMIFYSAPLKVEKADLLKRSYLVFYWLGLDNYHLRLTLKS